MADSNPPQGFPGGVRRFTALSDVPSSYVGQAANFLRVNAVPNGLEFVTPGTIAAVIGPLISFLQLSDTPNSYGGAGTNRVTVNVGETGLQFVPDTFLEEQDTPNSYVGTGGDIVRVNAGETGLEFVTPGTIASVIGPLISFLQLSDTPNSYANQGLNAVRVNAGETGLEFVTPGTLISIASFLDLSDTPNSYVGQAGSFVNVNAGETALQFVTPGTLAGVISPSLIPEITNKGRQWIQHGNNIVTLRRSQLDNNFIIKSTIFLPHGAIDKADPVTYRGVYHAGSAQANSMAITCIPETVTEFSIKLNGGFGFTSGGNTGVVSAVTQRFDDIANTQTPRTGLTTARDNIAGFSLNGLGFTCGGDTGAVSGVVERFDDVNNAHTTRVSLAPATERSSMFTLNGRGFIQGGTDTVDIVYGLTNRFDDISNIWQSRTGLILSRFDGSGFGINNFGFSVAGDTIIDAGGIVSTVERFDDVANNNTSRAPITTARDTIGTYVIDEFGFASGGLDNAGLIRDITERFDDTTNIWVTVTSLATPRFAMTNGYSLNGFGFTSCGAITGPANSGITDRYDNVANTHNVRTAATARAAPGEYATNEFFVEYNTENVSEFDEIWNLGTAWIAHGDNVITLAQRHNNLDFRSEVVLQLPLGAISGANSITYRGPAHSRPMTITSRPDDPYVGFGFTSGGFAAVAVSAITEQYDDPTQVTITKTALQTARQGLAGYSYSGYGYTSCGNTGTDAAPVSSLLTERLDPIANVQTYRASVLTARNDLASFVVMDGNNVTLNPRGHVAGGWDSGTVAVTNLHDEFEDISNIQTVRQVLGTALCRTTGFAINQYGFVVGGATSLAGANRSNLNQRYDLIADTWSYMGVIPEVRYGMAGFAFGGFGYICGGSIDAANTSTATRRYSFATDSWSNMGNLVARYLLAGYAIQGFGFSARGSTTIAGANSNTLERYDPSTTVWSTRAPAPLLTSRRNLAGYANPTSDNSNGARLLVKLHGGFGFTSCGGAFTVTGVIDRFDDIANTQTPRLFDTAPRNGPTGYSLNGHGFTSGSVAPAGNTQRYDDVLNTYTVRAAITARGLLAGYSLNGLGITSCGTTGAVQTTTESFDDTTNVVATRANATARDNLAGYGLNGFGFTSGGDTTGIGAVTGITERFDNIGNFHIIRTSLTIARSTVAGFSVSGFGFASCGTTTGATAQGVGTTERLDDIANTQAGRASATARSFLACYSLNGFGFTNAGINTIGANTATVERFDDIANLWAVRASVSLARSLSAAYSTNEYFVNYSTMD